MKLNLSLPEFKLPNYNEIPDVGLFLEQVAKYINSCLGPLGEPELTGSMISNYVKKDIIANPVKKQYGRDQIACLIFIAITKIVLSLDDIAEIFKLYNEICSTKEAYEYFAAEFIRVLEAVFNDEELKPIKAGDDSSKEYVKMLSRNISITAAYKIYLDMTFAKLKAGAEEASAK